MRRRRDRRSRRVRHLADRGNADRPRHDRDVGVGGAFLQHQPAQPLAIVVEQRRGPHRARIRMALSGNFSRAGA